MPHITRSRPESAAAAPLSRQARNAAPRTGWRLLPLAIAAFVALLAPVTFGIDPPLRDTSAERGVIDGPDNSSLSMHHGAVNGQAGTTFQFLYDDDPTPLFVSPNARAVKYLAIYQDDVDPTTQETGIIDPAKVIARIALLRSQGWTGEWGMLDFEVPFDSVFYHGPTDPRYELCMHSLIGTIRAVKAAFPMVKWTYYAFPRISYWVLGKDWGYITEAQRVAQYAIFTARYGPLLAEMDWFAPSACDWYERSLHMPNSWSPPIEAEREYRRASVKAIRFHFESRGQPVPPIIPIVSPWFQPGGATSLRPVPRAEFHQEQIQPLIDAGADGIAIWGAMPYFLGLATTPNLPPGYAAAIAFCRARFCQEYLGGVPVNSVDWYSPATYNLIGGCMNQTLADAMQLIYEDATLQNPGP